MIGAAGSLATTFASFSHRKKDFSEVMRRA